MIQKCNTCPNLRSCINGRWCAKLQVYVEYLKLIECDNDNVRIKVHRRTLRKIYKTSVTV